MEDLRALRSLYKFLLTNDPRHLDDKARLLLKDLLDSAAENILSRSQAMISTSVAQSGVAKLRQNSKTPVLQFNALKPPLIGIKNPNTESIDSASRNDDECLHRNLTRPPETQSNSEFSISPSKLQNRKKRCRVCQQCIIKPETKSNNYNNKGDDRDGYQSLSGIDQSHSTRRTLEQNGNRVSADVFKEVNDSIKRIECGILSLQIDSGNAVPTSCSTSSVAASDSHLSSPDTRSKQEAGYGFTNQTVQQELQVSNRTNSLMEEDKESLASATTRFTNVKNMVARIESMNQAPNKTSEPHRVSAMQRHNHIAKNSGDLIKAKPSKPQNQLGRSSTKGSVAKQRMFVGPTLLNYESDRKVGTTSRGRAQSKHGKMLLQREISSSTSPSRRSSTMNSQESSIFSSSIEPSSDSGDVASSNKSSRSFDSSLQGSPSYELSEENKTEESERIISSASPSYYSTDEDSPPRRLGKRRMHNRSLSSRSERRRKLGRLRRLKNKLGIIFHHHHHHHHHHHNATTSKSMWKNLQKMVFHHKQDNNTSHIRVKKEPKSSKALVNRNKKNKQQMGQFHSLVEGLVRHVRHKSDKSKPNHVTKKNGLLRKKQTPKNRAKVKIGFKSRQPKALKR